MNELTLDPFSDEPDHGLCDITRSHLPATTLWIKPVAAVPIEYAGGKDGAAAKFGTVDSMVEIVNSNFFSFIKVNITHNY